VSAITAFAAGGGLRQAPPPVTAPYTTQNVKSMTETATGLMVAS
jgi:hypothetical protein